MEFCLSLSFSVVTLTSHYELTSPLRDPYPPPYLQNPVRVQHELTPNPARKNYEILPLARENPSTCLPNTSKSSRRKHVGPSGFRAGLKGQGGGGERRREEGRGGGERGKRGRGGDRRGEEGRGVERRGEEGERRIFLSLQPEWLDLRMQKYIYIYIYVYVCMRTYIYIYVYIYMCQQSLL